MAFANLSDVSTRLGRPISDLDEVAQVNAWIGDVEALILARLPLLVPGVDGAPSAAVLSMIVANAVIRKIKNPDGKVSEGVDDYNYRYSENARRGEVFLTDEEWALLTPVSSSGAFSTQTFGASSRDGVWVHPDVWVPAP